MNKLFYPRLAIDSVRKNKQMYVPYLLTWIAMVMMYYIIVFLQYNEAVASLPGGDSLRVMMGLGTWVIAIFSGVFLTYTNSFLMKRRKKEFGLYNILGMEKRNINRVLLCETFGIYAVALVVGIVLGITFSKFTELLLINIMKGEVTYRLTVSSLSIRNTVILFAVISVILYLNALRQIRFSTAIELVKSEAVGEKEPKGNLFLGLLGLVLLGWAYYLAVTIDNPISAMMIFFFAVVLVIAATYLLMISGSVVLCRLLKKKKSFYYKPSHFVSVSSMAYRMKRNGAGLAGICILATMVLVTLSSTTSLYVGSEDAIYSMYPRDLNLAFSFEGIDSVTGTSYAEFRERIAQEVQEFGLNPTNEQELRMVTTTVILEEDGRMDNDPERVGNFSFGAPKSITSIVFLDLAEYNRYAKKAESLAPGEVLVYTDFSGKIAEELTLPNGTVYRVKEILKDMGMNGEEPEDVISVTYLILPDFDEEMSRYLEVYGRGGDESATLSWRYFFDSEQPVEVQMSFLETVREEIDGPEAESSYGFYSKSLMCRGELSISYYATYGGLFFLGIVLSFVFLAAAVLMIYYKQISEGFEDRKRFEIMQKVGMTKKEIRRSINSQLLIVFYLPLLGAGLHLCFAFPMLRKILLIFSLHNTKLFMATCLVCFLIFGLFYAVVYRVTSGAYFNIVSNRAKQEL